MLLICGATWLIDHFFLFFFFNPSCCRAACVPVFFKSEITEMIRLPLTFLFQVVDIKGKLKESKRFWSNLPDDMCSAVKLAEPDEEQCWNSHIQGRWGLQPPPAGPLIAPGLPGIKITPPCLQISTSSLWTIAAASVVSFDISWEAALAQRIVEFPTPLIAAAAGRIYHWAVRLIGQRGEDFFVWWRKCRTPPPAHTHTHPSSSVFSSESYSQQWKTSLSFGRCSYQFRASSESFKVNWFLISSQTVYFFWELVFQDVNARVHLNIMKL